MEELVQQAIKRRILLCRMVRDNLNRTIVQSQKQNCTAETQSQSQPPEEPAGPERAQSPESVNPESQEPTDRQLDLLFWSKFDLEEEPETWCQVSTKFDHFEAQIADFIALNVVAEVVTRNVDFAMTLAAPVNKSSSVSWKDCVSPLSALFRKDAARTVVCLLHIMVHGHHAQNHRKLCRFARQMLLILATLSER